MRLKKYNNGKILAPLKCGTRFMIETFGESNEDIGLGDLTRNLFLNGVEVIIIRPPYEHFESAVHTEILGAYNNNKGMEEVEEILQRFRYNHHTIESATHWSGHLYEHLYYYWRRNRKYLKVVELKNLSEYLVSEGIKIPEYNPDKYNFNHYGYWCSKEDLMYWVKTTFPYLWKDYMIQIENSNKYYDYLINKDLSTLKLL
jgi:hypothetical protein